MDPVYYTLNSINGDYAYLTSDTGVENQVAMFLLPDGADVGSRRCLKTLSGRCCKRSPSTKKIRPDGRIFSFSPRLCPFGISHEPLEPSGEKAGK